MLIVVSILATRGRCEGEWGWSWKWTLPLVIFLLLLFWVMHSSAALLVGQQMALLTECAPQGVKMNGWAQCYLRCWVEQWKTVELWKTVFPAIFLAGNALTKCLVKKKIVNFEHYCELIKALWQVRHKFEHKVLRQWLSPIVSSEALFWAVHKYYRCLL